MGKKKEAEKVIIDLIKESPSILAKLLPDVFENVTKIEVLDCKFDRTTTLPFTKGPDILLLVEPEEGEPFLFHIEFRDGNSDDYIKDMLQFYAEIGLLYGGFYIKQSLVYTGKDPVNMKDKIEETNLTFTMPIVNIREVNRDDYLSSDDSFRKLLGIVCDIKINNLGTPNSEIQRRVINVVNTGNYKVQASSVPSIKDMDDIDALIYNKDDENEWDFLKDLITRLGPELDFMEIKRLIQESESPDTVSKYLERHFT